MNTFVSEFCSSPFSDRIQIVLSLLSLIATIVVSVAIYWLQSRHEKEMQSMEERLRQKELREQATRFMIDNCDELEYLPWCVIAANVARLKKHTRKIYSDFCREPEELRNEILHQAGLKIRTLPSDNWVEPCFDRLRKDIEKYHLGHDYLYDGAKYFHRSQNYFDKPYDFTSRNAFEQITSFLSFAKVVGKDVKINIGMYISEYFEWMSNADDLSRLIQATPPIDYVWESQSLATTPDESCVCGWTMALVDGIAMTLYYRIFGYQKEQHDTTEAQVETFEDMYYRTLLDLHNTYLGGDTQMCKQSPGL